MRERYCFWSVATGPYAGMMARCIASAREVGVLKDFHVWSDQPVAGAIRHGLTRLDTRWLMFKTKLLRQRVKKLDYDYFVWLDADSWFTRNPGDVLGVLQGAPVHVTLESNLAKAGNPRGKFHGIPYDKFIRFMQFKGVCSRSIFTANGAFWVVHRDVIDTFVDLAAGFWIYCHKKGYHQAREEVALAYASQMLQGNSYLHTLEKTSGLWAPDRARAFRRRLPDGSGWRHEDPITHAAYRVNPAIVHVPYAQRLLLKQTQGTQTQAGTPTRTRHAK